MIHRALFGSVERFFAILLEHYAGALPTWLSPEQVRVLGVRDDHEAYAHKVADRLRAVGARVTVDPADEKLGARIRKAKVLKIPYILVVGDDDVAAGTVGVNRRGSDTARTRRGAHGLLRGARDARSPSAVCPKHRVTLDHLWAGWRSEYVTHGRLAGRGPRPTTTRATTPPGACSAASRPAGRRRPRTACCGGASSPSSSSTPTPMQRAI